MLDMSVYRWNSACSVVENAVNSAVDNMCADLKGKKQVFPLKLGIETLSFIAVSTKMSDRAGSWVRMLN